MSMYHHFLIISFYLSALFQKIGFYNHLHVASTYRAAIVEYSSFTGPITIDIHSDNYVKLIAQAAKYDVDIIVFSECGLMPDIPYDNRNKYLDISTFVPDPIDKITPHLDASNLYASFFKKLSRSAKKYQINVFVNVDEKAECALDDGQLCHPDKLNLYNTNVVFDRNGTVIARYRKYHLYDEPFKNITQVPQLSVFDTDFGVRFGTFTCYDILFQQPDLNLTRDLNISDIIFTTEWYSAYPFDHALQMQQGWAFKEHVNLLAANLNNPPESGSGSGIYHADKNVKDSMFCTNEENVTTMIISDVVKKNYQPPSKLFMETKQFTFDQKGRILERSNVASPPPRSQFDHYKILLHNFSNFSSIQIDSIFRQQVHRLCVEDFCCKISLTLETRPPEYNKNFYQYHFVIYNGLADYNLTNERRGVGICGLVACLNSSRSSCGDYYDEFDTIDWPMSFQKIILEANFESTPNITDFPNSIQPGFLPLNKDFWIYERINRSLVEFTLVKTIKQLLSFNVYLRNFTMDTPPDH